MLFPLKISCIFSRFFVIFRKENEEDHEDDDEEEEDNDDLKQFMSDIAKKV